MAAMQAITTATRHLLLKLIATLKRNTLVAQESLIGSLASLPTGRALNQRKPQKTNKEGASSPLLPRY
jgi:hypothetical protein